MKEKRFSFFADPQERKAESRPTFGTTCSDLSELPFAGHTSQHFAKVKEPNFSHEKLLIINYLLYLQTDKYI
jgi:hypothetical protein